MEKIIDKKYFGNIIKYKGFDYIISLMVRISCKLIYMGANIKLNISKRIN